MLEGSIGGLVELSTLNPLDQPGLHVSGSSAALYDRATDELTPQVSGVVSDTFRDDTIGAFLGVSYYEREWRSDTYESFARSTETVDSDADGVRNDQVDGRGVFPGIISYQVKSGERSRLGLVGAVQFRPSDRFETKLDVFFSDYQTPENAYSYNINFFSNDGWRRFQNATLEEFPGPGVNRWFITSFDLSDVPLEIGTDTKARKSATYMVGLNNIWRATDDLEFVLDVAYSAADRPNPGREYFTVAGVHGGNYTFNANDPVPTVSCTLSDGRNCLDVTNDEIGLHFMEQKGEQVNDEVLSVRLDSTYEFSIGNLPASLEVGAAHSSRTKDKVNYGPDNGCGYCGFSDLLGEVGVTAVVPFPDGGYGAGIIGGSNRWPALDANALFAAAIAARGQTFFDANIAARPRLRSSSEVDEKNYAAYVQTKFEADRWSGNVGVRWVRTDLTSSGYTQQLLALEPIPNSTNFLGTFSEVVPVSLGNSYDDFLPSANFSYELTDSLVLRLAASRAITRPTISQLGVDVNWEINSLPPRVSRNGNPDLEPVESTAADLSLEWYGDQGSSAAVALFYKDINGFITPALFPEEIIGETFNVSAPINGDTAKIKGAELAFQHLFESGFGFQANYTYAQSDANITINDLQVSTSLDGLSEHTYNLVGLYEKNALSARLAWSYRSDYVACSTCGPVGQPTTTDSMGFLDLSASYAFNDGFTAYLEAFNLTQEDTHTYSVDRRITMFYEPFARRYEMGVRLKF